MQVRSRGQRVCQALTGSWLVINVERLPTRSSSTSSRSLRSAAPIGEIAKSSMTNKSSLANCEAPREAAVAVRDLQLIEQARCPGVERREARARRLMSQGTGQPRLAAPGHSRDQQVLPAAQPVAPGQCDHQRSIVAALTRKRRTLVANSSCKCP